MHLSYFILFTCILATGLTDPTGRPVEMRKSGNTLDDNHTMKQAVEAPTRVKRAREATPTGVDEFKWTAHLDITFNTFSNECGGTLISDFYVLTAAHCLSPPPSLFGYYFLEGINVTLLEHNKRTPIDCTTLPHHPWRKCTQNIRVTAEGHKIHPWYDWDDLRNDIALVRLPGETPFTKYVPRIQLPYVDIDAEKYRGLPLRVIGWGTNGYYKPDIKQSAVLNLIPHKWCQRYGPSFRIFVSRSQLCAMGVNGENACEGDSGGPLVAMNSSGHYILVGIVSGLSESPCSIGPSTYTNVYHYLNWIHQTMTDYEKNRLHKKYQQFLYNVLSKENKIAQ